MGKEKICVALDVDSFEEALDLTRRLSPWVGVFKIGYQLFTSEGPRIAEAIIGQGADVFLDLKYHDIPNTVVSAARVALRLGVKMLNVHCLGGSGMMRMLVEELGKESEAVGKPVPLLLGVTVLTSLSEQELHSELKVSLPLEEYVVHLAKLAQDAGMHGVVCSPREIAAIRQACGPDFTLVTPGIRPAWIESRDDQERITSPQAAICNGADYIVVGRPIIAAKDPEEAAKRLLLELVTSTCNFQLK
uniref:Orotidine 5'-phosphate decarboxylase n=1 Tax=Candidatus Kentrum sp. UNK TaxID=2126344 RepID=A0A451ATZ8_9GAMM|nr:MAG: orotidine-5'-phosphate decarboxylase [Candidatus Kentron sp. UNK]VFK69502.1 MAG: orotidine-5'-phosphate decarboxylase [Candidatus Kentron sp. UNK]